MIEVTTANIMMEKCILALMFVGLLVVFLGQRLVKKQEDSDKVVWVGRAIVTVGVILEFVFIYYIHS